MIVVGLTGSIGMGKSVAANRFRDLGIAVFDADGAVHDLYAGGAVPLIEAAFPGSTSDGVVDRALLSKLVAGSDEQFRRLEAIVHPLVQAAERRFLRKQVESGASIAVLEVPLLFETGLHEKLDRVVVVSAPSEMQRERVLKREGMTVEKFEDLLARQMPDAEKRSQADFVVDTSGPIAASAAQIDDIVAWLKGETGMAYDRFWLHSEG